MSAWRRWLDLLRGRRAVPAQPSVAEPPNDDDDVDLAADAPIALAGDELDLHTFAPRDVADVVDEYVQWAAQQGTPLVRIIHGKGKGTLRRVVHGVLQRHPCVVAHGLCDERSGGWGATWARLQPPPPPPDEKRGIVAP